QRQEEKKQERATRKEIEALDRQTNSLWDITKTLVKAHLLLAGYHQHHRYQWRRRRLHNNRHERDTNMVPQLQGQEKLSIEDLNAIIDRAMTGDESTLPTIRELLAEAPAIWQTVFGLAKRVESAWIQTIAKQDLITREALERQVADLKKTLQTEFSSPLE